MPGLSPNTLPSHVLAKGHYRKQSGKQGKITLLHWHLFLPMQRFSYLLLTLSALLASATRMKGNKLQLYLLSTLPSPGSLTDFQLFSAHVLYTPSVPYE